MKQKLSTLVRGTNPATNLVKKGKFGYNIYLK